VGAWKKRVAGRGYRVNDIEGRVEKMKPQSYKELIVYQKAYRLTLDVYRITKKFPHEEL
jgi:hypothetical protein